MVTPSRISFDKQVKIALVKDIMSGLVGGTLEALAARSYLVFNASCKRFIGFEGISSALSLLYGRVFEQPASKKMCLILNVASHAIAYLAMNGLRRPVPLFQACTTTAISCFIDYATRFLSNAPRHNPGPDSPPIEFEDELSQCDAFTETRSIAQNLPGLHPIPNQPLSLSEIGKLPPIEENYTEKYDYETQLRRHIETQGWLKDQLNSIGGTKFTVFRTKDSLFRQVSDNILNRDDAPAFFTELKNPLDPSVFSYLFTEGVQYDIQKAGKETDCVQIFGIASQFNGGESKNRSTVPPGEAFNVYKFDRTQGPLAQLQFIKLLIESFNTAANFGLNNLIKLLSESTKDAVSHGFLSPKTPEQAEKLIEQLKTKADLIEYSCVRAIPTEADPNSGAPVWQFFTSAPAFGRHALIQGGKRDEDMEDEIAYRIAFSAYEAQFQFALQLAKDQSSTPVILKPALMGTGDFGNRFAVICKAFYDAALLYTNDLKEAKNVQVQMQIFGGDGVTARGDRSRKPSLDKFLTHMTPPRG